jgi:hypothetical protein
MAAAVGEQDETSFLSEISTPVCREDFMLAGIDCSGELCNMELDAVRVLLSFYCLLLCRTCE